MIEILLAALVAASSPQGEDTTRLAWVPNPRVSYGGWVSDPARHLRPATIEQLNASISQLERETTTEIAVVVLDSLDGLEPGAAALLLHRRWGVGKSGRNNGVLVLWSPALRKTFVSVGYGLEGRITDSRAGRIQDAVTIPHFRRGEFDLGMIRTVEALASLARNETFVVPVGPRRVSDTTADDPILPWWVILGAIVALVVGGYRFTKSKGPRKLDRWLTFLFTGRLRAQRCAGGHGKMRRLAENAEHPYLSEEQIVEKRIKSREFDVWVCDRCDRRVVRAYDGDVEHGRCPECSRRTLKKRSKIRVAPTFKREGEADIRMTCENCGYEATKTEKVERRSVSSGSSGSWSSGGSSGGGGFSGGSSFGGGSSGGGGAGRSY